ncbi:MAG: cupin [Candidatus Eremiobacteraeota bacterium]|nr:cupin [Candidatus Eremiobacteraeota bacterium]
MMQAALRYAAVAGFAFVAGFTASHVPAAVQAQSPAPGPTPVAMPSAYYLDIEALATNPAPACFPNARLADISISSAATVQYLVGTLPAHYHSTANEIQFVLSGSGTELFGARTVRFRPGTIFVIPPGGHHSHMVADAGSGPLKFLVVKAPRQQPNDNHLLNPPGTC